MAARSVTLSHSGHVHTVVLYKDLPVAELQEVLGSVFDFRVRDTHTNATVIGFKEVKGGEEGVVVPISLACRFPEHLSAAQYELVLTGHTAPSPTPPTSSGTSASPKGPQRHASDVDSAVAPADHHEEPEARHMHTSPRASQQPAHSTRRIEATRDAPPAHDDTDEEPAVDNEVLYKAVDELASMADSVLDNRDIRALLELIGTRHESVVAAWGVYESHGRSFEALTQALKALALATRHRPAPITSVTTVDGRRRPAGQPHMLSAPPPVRPVPDELMKILNDAVDARRLTTGQALLVMKLWTAGQGAQIVNAWERYQKSKDTKVLVQTIGRRLACAKASDRPEGSAAATDGSVRGLEDDEDDDDDDVMANVSMAQEEDTDVDPHALDKAIKELIDFLFTAHVLSLDAKVTLRGLCAARDGRLLAAYHDFMDGHKQIDTLAAALIDTARQAEAEKASGVGLEEDAGIELSALKNFKDQRSEREEFGVELVTVNGTGVGRSSFASLDASGLAASSSTLSPLPHSPKSELSGLPPWTRHRLEVLDRLTKLKLLPRAVYRLVCQGLERGDQDVHDMFEASEGEGDMGSLASRLDEAMGIMADGAHREAERRASLEVGGSPTIDAISSLPELPPWTQQRLCLLDRLASLRIVPRAVYNGLRERLEEGDPELHDVFDAFEFEGDMGGLAAKLGELVHHVRRASDAAGAEAATAFALGAGVGPSDWVSRRLEVLDRLAALHLIPHHMAAQLKQRLEEGDPELHDLFHDAEYEGDMGLLAAELEKVVPQTAHGREPCLDASISALVPEAAGDWLRARLDVFGRLARLHVIPSATARTLKKRLLEGDPVLHDLFHDAEVEGDMATLVSSLEKVASEPRGMTMSMTASRSSTGYSRKSSMEEGTEALEKLNAAVVCGRAVTERRLEVLERLAKLHLIPGPLYTHLTQRLEEGDPALHDLFDDAEFEGDMGALHSALEAAGAGHYRGSSTGSVESHLRSQEGVPASVGEESTLTRRRVELLTRMGRLGLLPPNTYDAIKERLEQGDPDLHDIFDSAEFDGDMASLATELEDHMTALMVSAGPRAVPTPMSKKGSFGLEAPPPVEARGWTKQRVEALEAMAGAGLLSTQAVASLHERLLAGDATLHDLFDDHEAQGDISALAADLKQYASNLLPPPPADPKPPSVASQTPDAALLEAVSSLRLAPEQAKELRTLIAQAHPEIKAALHAYNRTKDVERLKLRLADLASGKGSSSTTTTDT